MTEPTVVHMQGVNKNFGTTPALNDVNISIEPGSVVGVLGPNGGGKTTLLRHVPGLLLPTSGTVDTFGRPAAELDADTLARIGFVSQETHLMDWLNVGETVDFVAAGLPTWDGAFARRLLGEFDLDPSKDVSSLSMGMKQRLAIVLSVAHRPELLLLDEPASSLDPVAREDFLHLLMDLIQETGRTIMVSSHILSDVEKIIDQVLIIDQGRVHCYQSLDELREAYHRVELTAMGDDLPDPLPLPGLLTASGDRRHAVAVAGGVDRAELERSAEAWRADVQVRHLEFEEIYRLVVTGKGGRS